MTVDPVTLLCLTLATLAAAALPVVLYRRLRRPLALDWRDTVAGIAVFALFATVLERALNGYMLHGNAVTAAWLSNRYAFAAYGALAAGVCEEAGRFVAMRLLHRMQRAPAARDRTGFGYGIGHGGAEIWLVGVFVQAQWILFAVLMNRGELDQHLGDLPVESVLRVHMVLASLSPWFAGLFLVERAAAFAFQMGLSVLMWRGMQAGWKGILPLAIAAHALVDLPAALYQARLAPLVAVDAVYAVCALAVAAVLVRVYRSNRPESARA